MRPLSPAAQDAMSSGGEFHARVEIRNPATGAVVADTASGQLLIDGGAVVEDWRRAYRRTLSVTVTQPDTDPGLAKLLAVRGGYDIVPYTGWRWGNGLIEEWQQGVFRVTATPRLRRTGPGVQWSLTGTDWSRRVARAGFEARYVITKDSNVGDSIADLVRSRITSDITVQGCGCSYTTPRMTYAAGDNPWASALTLAEGAGLDLYFNAAGELVVRDRPSVTDPPNLTFDSSSVVVTEASIRDDDENFANVVVVVGTNPALLFPISGIARDDNPESPTYYLGPVGTHTKHIDNNTLFSAAAAQRMATVELEKLLGSDSELQLTHIATHALEAGDRIDVTQPDLGVAERVVIDRLEHPLTPRRPARTIGRVTGAVPL